MKNMQAVKPRATTKGNSFGTLRTGVANAQLKMSPGFSKEIHYKISDIKKGYPIGAFEQLKKDFGINQEKLAKIASISLATIHRRKTARGRLTAGESEKIYRLEKLYKTAVEVMESKDDVKVWFNTPQPVFAGQTPLDFADTLPGSEEVENVLRRIEHGIVL